MRTGGSQKARERHSALTWDVPPLVDLAESSPGLLEHAARTFHRPSSAHLAAIVGHLLRVGGLDPDPARAEVLVSLAESAASGLSPSALAAAGTIDPCRYVKVKKVASPGATLADSSVVRGVACRKNVAHKRMARHATQPRVMLVRGALERAGDALSSFDSLLDQERKQLQGMVEHIASFKPHVLLVGKSVARFAQELLLAHNISLVLNVKVEVLERLARCLDIEVADSVAALSSRNVGFCKEFVVEACGGAAVESLPASPKAALPAAEDVLAAALSQKSASQTAPKPLMLFHGCPRPLGVTILLRGASLGELQFLKQVALFATFVAYYARLEASFFSELMLGIGAEDAGAGRADALVEEIGAAAEHSALRVRSARGRGLILSPSAHISQYEEPGVRLQTLDEYLESGVLGSQPSAEAAPDGVAPENGQPLACAPPSRGGRVEQLTSALRVLRLTLSCKNPSKGALCEPPHGYRMKVYDEDDLSLGTFMASAVPADRKCPNPACGDGAQLHLRSFMRGNGLVTLSSARLSAEARLPDNRIFFWVRPAGEGDQSRVRRVALSRDAACVSFAHLLSLLLDARDVAFRGASLQSDYVRFIATGSVVLCLHYSRMAPFCIQFPPPSLALSVDAECAWLRREVRELTEEFDEAMSALEGAVEHQLALAQASAAAQAWRHAVDRTRAAAMAALHQLQTDLESRVARLQDGTEAVPFVWEVNRVRRLLAALLDRWRGALARLAGDEAPKASPGAATESPHKSAASLELPQKTLPAGAPLPERSVSAQASPSPFDEAAGEDAFPESEPIPIRPPRPHARHHSDSIARQFASSYQDEPAALDAQKQPQYAAPKLQSAESSADPAVALPAAAAAAAARGQSPIIPTGLVARYVSMFEDATRTSATSPRGSPGSSPPISSALSWNAKNWVESRRRSLAEEQLRGPSIANFEIRAGGGARIGASHGSPAWRARRESAACTVAARLEELAHVVEDLPLPSAESSRAGTEAGGAELALFPGAPAGDSPEQGERSHFEQWSAIIPESALSLHAELPVARSRDAKHQEPHAALPELAAPSPAALAWKGRALLPAGQDGVSITIFDQEPTSIIAYALASGAYKQYVQEAISSINQGDGEAGEAHVKAKAALPEELFSTSVLYSESPLHCQFTVQDGSSDVPATLQVTAYYAPQFHEFRKEFLNGGDAAFVASLSRCMQWESKGGKSNVYFAKTRDDRLIVKQLSKAEKQSILEFIPAYFKYLGTAREAGQESCLARILGVYQVHIHWQGKEHGGANASSGKDVVMELLIMENFFYGRSIQRVYDLKGSERDRYVVENPKAIGAVLLDENLKEMNLSSPTVVGPYAFGRLQRAVWSDTGFLSNVGVMDYSLLVGVDKTKHELVIGIIDFIRQFTFDKAVEMYVKKTGLLGGGGKNPTVLSPRHYSSRFRSAMNTWLTPVPVDSEKVSAIAAEQPS